MRFSNVRKLKSKTSEVLRQAVNGDPTIITSHGKPKALLIGIEKEDDLEDLLLLYDPVLREKIEEGLEDVRKGKVVSLDTYLMKKTKRPKK